MQEYRLKKTIDLVFARVADSLGKSKARPLTSQADLAQAIDHHLREIKNWSSEVSFADLKGAKATADVFIPLELMLSPRRIHVSQDEQQDLVALEDLLGDPSTGHVIILGQPGAGKTTSMKHICQRLLSDAHFANAIDFPILIRLHEINGRAGGKKGANILLRKLEELLGIRIGYEEELSQKENAEVRRAIRNRVVVEAVDAARILLVLDGFDEIASLPRRDALIEELRELAQQLERSRIVLTSRTGEFNYHIENMRQLEISPLSDAQVLSFASRWLGPEDGNLLVDQISQSPFADTAIRPLTIAHLCAIYERSRKIPDKPKTVYRKIVNLLVEEWDEQRSVKRSSTYASFDVDRKFEFLSQLAYTLTTSLKGSAFSKQDLVAAYRRFHGNFGLPELDATKVANELETHTGLFVQAGYEAFEFSHKSLQEYLAAEFIVRLPSIPTEKELLEILPNELAIATAISSTPSEYFAELVLGRFGSFQLPFASIRTFVSRLLLERPDFEVTPRVGAALLALYSQYLHSMLQSSEQLHLFVIDQLGVDFEQLSGLIEQRVFEEDLLGVFEVFEQPPAMDGGRILRLRRRKDWVAGSPGLQPGDARAVLARSLPPDVWVRPSLLVGLHSKPKLPSSA